MPALSSYAAVTSLADTDRVPVITNPGVAGGNKYITAANLAIDVAPPLNDRGIVANSTVYNPNDVVVVNGARVIIKTQVTSSGAGFISGSNYTKVAPIGYLFVSDFSGWSADGNQATASANTAALQAAVTACNPTNTNGAGGTVVINRGTAYINATISIPSGVTIMGSGPFGTYLSLADGSNCTMLKPHTSTGSGDPNAFWGTIRDLTLDCRQASQGNVVTTASITNTSTTITNTSRAWVSGEIVVGTGILPGTTISAPTGAGPFSATMSNAAQQTISGFTVYAGLSAAIYGIHLETNPLNTSQTGDFGFDPSWLIHHVHIRNSRDGGIISKGRSDTLCQYVKISHTWGAAFQSSFDCHYAHCIAEYPAWYGFRVSGSSCQYTGCKAYNSGQNKSTGATNPNLGNGWFSDFGITECAISGCDSQQTSGNAYHFKNANDVAIAGCNAKEPGFSGGSGVGYYWDNSNYCVVQGTHRGIASSNALALVGGSDSNTFVITHSPSGAVTLGTNLAAGSTLASNAVTINGTVVNMPGLTSGVVMGTAVRTSTATHTMVLPFASSLGTALNPPTLNVLYVMRYTVERQGMKAYWASCRPTVIASVASIARAGIYISGGGNAVATLLGEFTALESNVPFDLATTGGASNAVRQTTALATPLVIPGLEFYVAFVVQTATTSLQLQGVTGGTVGASGNNPVPAAAWQAASGVTGALPSTIFSVSPSAPPTSFGTAPAVGIGMLD